MRARNERENKNKKGANYWSTWRKTKDAVGTVKGRGGENDRKADSCGETERTKITMKREARGKDEIKEEEETRGDRKDGEKEEEKRERR